MSAPTAVLGLCAFVHDSATALIVDGVLVGFVEEERLNGDKHSRLYPEFGVAWALDQAGLGPGDINAVGYHLDGDRFLGAIPATVPMLFDRSAAGLVLPRMRSLAVVHRRFRARMGLLAERFPNAEVRPVLHHRAHGLYAFTASGFERAAVLVVDSLGERQATTIAAADGNGWHLRWAQDDPASLGYAYGAVTMHLGWRRGDEEGTVMALAATGDPARFGPVLKRAIAITDGGIRLNHSLLSLRVLSSKYPRTTVRFADLTCRPRSAGESVEQVHADLAAALQERTEQAMMHLARLAKKVTGSNLLVLGGGVAANCVAAGRIVRSGLFDEVFVPPAPGDSGTAIGAGLAVWADTRGGPVSGAKGTCYLGPSYPAWPLADEPRPGMRAHTPEKPARFLAEQLADGKIVGVFQGRLEAGPRALGHRSILASPLAFGVVDRLNATVKFREPFRPFAPIVPADRAEQYFTLGQPAPFMSFAPTVTDLARRTVPAIVHANGTSRMQTLTAASEPFIAEVLDEFEKITGVPILINTSLNVKGKPICGTPDMALDCLAETGLDALLLEGRWVVKS